MYNCPFKPTYGSQRSFFTVYWVVYFQYQWFFHNNFQETTPTKYQTKNPTSHKGYN